MENLISLVKESGAKLTNPRKQILGMLSESNKPLTLKEIHEECNNIDFASVYRSIKLFYELGLVNEINFADNKIRYELSTHKHHHHIICSECGEIKELPICILSEIETLTDYTITKHNLEFLGLCPKCKK